MTPRSARDDGSIAVELAILLPLCIGLIALGFVAGRLVIAQGAIDLAAHDAARTASLYRNAGMAKARASSAARATLSRQGLHCGRMTVDVDVSQFRRPVGQPASVTVVVTCRVSFADLALPGAPASRELTARFTSPLDQYRSRG